MKFLKLPAWIFAPSVQLTVFYFAKTIQEKLFDFFPYVGTVIVQKLQNCFWIWNNAIFKLIFLPNRYQLFLPANVSIINFLLEKEFSRNHPFFSASESWQLMPKTLIEISDIGFQTHIYRKQQTWIIPWITQSTALYLCRTIQRKNFWFWSLRKNLDRPKLIIILIYQVSQIFISPELLAWLFSSSY